MMRKRTRSAGFTLIELLAVLGVIVLVSTIIFANNSRFGGKMVLENLAYEIALTIRQVQSYGISVIRFEKTGAFEGAYGIYFNANTNASKKSYVIFADRKPQSGLRDGKYGGASERIQLVNFNSGYQVNALYVNDCAVEVKVLQITFERPSPNAVILGDGALFDDACIELKSPRRDFTARVHVYRSGQIAVE